MNKLIENFILLDRISASEFSDVFKCKHKLTNEFFAIKVVSFEKFSTNPKYQEQLSNELHALKALENSAHIIKFTKLLKTKNNVYLVYEFCEGGTLQDFEEKNKILNESDALEILGQLVEGLSIIHSNKIVHGDLKPSNLLFKDKVLKIVDFGFCKFTQNEQKKIDLSKYFIGSPIYMSPELFENSETSEKSDVYAVGVIFYEMLFGMAPFEAKNIEELVEKLKNNYVLNFPREINNISDESEKILRDLLDKDPMKRLSVFELRDLLMKKPKNSNNQMKEIKEMEMKKNFNDYFEEKNLHIDPGKKVDSLNNVEQYVNHKNMDQFKAAVFSEMNALFIKKLPIASKGILIQVNFLKSILELNIHESNACFVLHLLKRIRGAYIDLILALEKNFNNFFTDIMKMPSNGVDPDFLEELRNEELVKNFVGNLIREEKKCEDTLNSYKNTLKYSFELTDYTNVILKDINEDLYDEQDLKRSGMNYLKNLKEISNYFYMNCKNEALLKEILIHGNLAFEILKETRNFDNFENKLKELSVMTIVNLHNLFDDKYNKGEVLKT